VSPGAGPGAPRIYVSAGEPSGDAHAAAVVTALRRRLPDARFEAFGGPALEAAGAAVVDRMERMSVVGFVEALWQIPAHFRLLARVSRAFRAQCYDLVILVDYPGYHLRAAAAARAAGSRCSTISPRKCGRGARGGSASSPRSGASP